MNTMKDKYERFRIFKEGYVNGDGSIAEATMVGEPYDTEAEAKEVLVKLDTDSHYIDRQEWTYITDGVHDWEVDDNYGHTLMDAIINQA